MALAYDVIGSLTEAVLRRQLGRVQEDGYIRFTRRSVGVHLSITPEGPYGFSTAGNSLHLGAGVDELLAVMACAGLGLRSGSRKRLISLPMPHHNEV